MYTPEQLREIDIAIAKALGYRVEQVEANVYRMTYPDGVRLVRHPSEEACWDYYTPHFTTDANVALQYLEDGSVLYRRTIDWGCGIPKLPTQAFYDYADTPALAICKARWADVFKRYEERGG